MYDQLKFAARRSLKRLMVHAGLEAISLSGARTFLPSAAGRGVIFALHHVRPLRNHDFEPNKHLSITSDFLEQAIIAARQCGLEPVHLEDLPKALAESPSSKKFVCFTLDDGYRDNKDYAGPIFRKHRIPYTVFVVPGFVERTRTMWWETAEEFIRATTSFTFDFGSGVETVVTRSRLEKLVAFKRIVNFFQEADEDEAVARLDFAAKEFGIDPLSIVDREAMTVSELHDLLADPLARLGVHTMTHPNLARVDAGRLKQELQQSAVRIAEYTGSAPKTLAYPYGGRSAVTARETKAATEIGFSLALTTSHGVLRSTSMEAPTGLPRISLNGNYQKARFVKALASGVAFDLT
jgi:peptidoglycan/xylan/chitin deacetylase (PgdA/CDA1 family)